VDRPPLGARPPEAVVQAGVSPRLRSVGRARRPVATPAMAKVPVILEGAAIGAERAPGREQPASDVRARLAPGPEGSLRGARPLHPREVPVDEPPVRVHEWNLTGRVATSSGTVSPRPASLRRERAGKHPRQPTHRRVVGKRIRGDELPDRSRPLQAHAGKRARRREERPFAVNEAEHWGDRRHRVVEDGAGTATVRGVARRRRQERDAKTRGP
jgi:hypothetical protein